MRPNDETVRNIIRISALPVAVLFCLFALVYGLDVDRFIPIVRRVIASPYTLPLALGGSTALVYYLFVVEPQIAQPAANEHQSVIVIQQDSGVSVWAVIAGVALGLVAVWWLRGGDIQSMQSAVAPVAQQLPQSEVGQQMPTITTNSRYEQAWANVSTVAPQCTQWRELAETYAGQHDIDPLLVTAIWYHESGCDAGAVNSTTRATGLGQVMPRDAWRFASVFTNLPTSAELKNPALNADWSTRILAGTLRGNDTLYGALDDYSGGHGRAYYDSVTSIYEQFTRNTDGQQSQSKAPGVQSPARSAFATTPYDPMPPVAQQFKNPISYQACGFHTGIDLGKGAGTPVRAVEAGVVVFVGPLYGNASYRGGNVVVIDHGTFDDGDHLYTAYSHGSQALVREGEQVHAGQPVIVESNQGYGSVSHLHFEVYKGRFTPATSSFDGLGPNQCAPGWLNPTDYLPKG